MNYRREPTSPGFSIKSKIGATLGSLSTLSGVLALLEHSVPVLSWLSTEFSKVLGFDAVRLALIGGGISFPIYLFATVISSILRGGDQVFTACVLDKREFEPGETVFF